MGRMLSLQHCRKVLGAKVAISDDDLATLRAQLYCFAELALDLRSQKRKAFDSRIACLEQAARSPEELESLLERAAIIEFDGKVPRDEAERMATTFSLVNKQVN